MITVLFDNYGGSPGLQTAWGFSCLVEGFDRTVLFDTGSDGRMLLANMDRLGLRPDRIDAVVLSHDHWDHTGGLDALLAAHGDVEAYLPKVFPDALKSRVEAAGGSVRETAQATEVCSGVWTTAVLGARPKEQGLCVRTPFGPVIITGCAHPGIVKLARSGAETCAEPVRAALGGFHMADMSRRKIARVIDELKELGVTRAGPCHCSGDETRSAMQSAFGKGYLDVAVGSRLNFDD